MSNVDDRNLSPEEKAEVLKRKMEISVDKKTNRASSLNDLKKEVGIPEKGDKK